MLIIKRRPLAVCALFLFSVAPGYAAAVQLVGDTMIYEYDDGVNATALLTFGTPSILGDTVRFLPPSFEARSVGSDGDGLVTTAESFVFSNVYSISGAEIVSIALTEFGDYKITNGDNVSVDAELEIKNNPGQTESAMVSSSFAAMGDSGVLPQFWQVDLDINPALEFISSANDVSLTIHNTLKAETDAFDEVAWIQKKFTITTAAIPVPASVWLFGSALGLLGVARRRFSGKA